MFSLDVSGHRAELRWDFREKLISERVTLPDRSLFFFLGKPLNYLPYIHVCTMSATFFFFFPFLSHLAWLSTGHPSLSLVA